MCILLYLVVQLENLQALLKETLTVSSDEGVNSKLAEAQKLVSTLKSRQSLFDEGVLSKFNLDGKVALVTGGGQGIGEALGMSTIYIYS
jgi:hypothetical protein